MTLEIAQNNKLYVRYVGHSGPFSDPEYEGLETVKHVDTIDVTTIEVPDWAHGFQYVQASSPEEAKKAKSIGEMTCFLGNVEQVVSCADAKQSDNIMLQMMAEFMQGFGTDRMFFTYNFSSSIGMKAQDVVLDPETREIVSMPLKPEEYAIVQKLLTLGQ